MMAIQWRGLGSRGVIFALALLLAASCAPQEPDEGRFETVEGFAGLVAADEPRAAVIGRDILGNGGNAADAAVAMYFAMTVTLPSRAGLGGGGVCLVFDSKVNEGTVYEFLPTAAPGGGVIPRGPRAITALHSRHGLLRWEQLLGPAEGLARLGHGVSRALARDVALLEGRVPPSSALYRMMQTRSGTLPTEGDLLVQPELSAILSGIRSQGGIYLYTGNPAERFSAATAAVGMPIDTTSLREAVPNLLKPIEIEVGNEVAMFTPPPAANGAVVAQIWGMLTDVEAFDDAGDDEADHLFVEAARRAFADRGAWLQQGVGAAQPAELVSEARLEVLMSGYDENRATATSGLRSQPKPIPESPVGAGFVVGDRFGSAVACSMTMNGLFGSGRIAQGTGVLLAAPSDDRSNAIVTPVAAVIANKVNGDAHLAAAASGGVAAATALARTLLDTVLREQPLKQALAARRVHHSGLPDAVFHESGLEPARAEALRRRGHELRNVGEIANVSAFYCKDGIVDDGDDCALSVDPRSSGLATVVQ